jgi:MFS family permease
MKLNNLFALTTILSGLFGLGFALVPATVYDLYGIEEVTDFLTYTSQLFGAALIGFAIISWMARSLSDVSGRKVIVTGFFVELALGAVLAIIGQFRDSAVAMGWLNVVIYVVLALGFGYFLFIKPESN